MATISVFIIPNSPPPPRSIAQQKLVGATKYLELVPFADPISHFETPLAAFFKELRLLHVVPFTCKVRGTFMTQYD